MDNRKIIGIGVVVLGAVLLAYFVYLIFFQKFSAPEAEQSPEVTQTQTDQPKITEQDSIDARSIKIQEIKRSREEINQDALKRMAGLFAERFGSFSTQSTFQNMSDLELFMTDRMAAWSKKYVAEKVANKDDSKNYYGITTKAVTTEVEKYDTDAGEAVIKVGTYRRESTGAVSNSSSFSQKITIVYKKERGAWKVDEARWDDQKIN